MTYSDYVFWDHSRGNVLETESLPTRQVEEFAQKLARRHKCRVAYAEVKDYFIEPDKCEKCGEVLPESGPCWCSSYQEEEADAQQEILKAN